jgi:hypothetical protein
VSECPYFPPVWNKQAEIHGMKIWHLSCCSPIPPRSTKLNPQVTYAYVAQKNCEEMRCTIIMWGEERHSKKCRKNGFWGTVRMDSGWLRVARGGCGAPVAARPRGCRNSLAGVVVSWWFIETMQTGWVLASWVSKTWFLCARMLLYDWTTFNLELIMHGHHVIND